MPIGFKPVDCSGLAIASQSITETILFALLVTITPVKDVVSEMVLGGLGADRLTGGLITSRGINLAV